MRLVILKRAMILAAFLFTIAGRTVAQTYKDTSIYLTFETVLLDAPLKYKIIEPPSSSYSAIKNMIIESDNAFESQSRADSVFLLLRYHFPHLRRVYTNASLLDREFTNTLSANPVPISQRLHQPNEVFESFTKRLATTYKCCLMVNYYKETKPPQECLGSNFVFNQLNILNTGFDEIRFVADYAHRTNGVAESYPRDLDMETEKIYGIRVIYDSLSLNIGDCKTFVFRNDNGIGEVHNYVLMDASNPAIEPLKTERYSRLKSLRLYAGYIGALEKLVIEKPIANLNIWLDTSITNNLKYFRMWNTICTKLPQGINSCKKLNTLSLNVLGLDESFIKLDVFKNLQTLELYNCAKLTSDQQDKLLNSSTLAGITKLSLTYPPGKDFLFALLSKCNNLKTFETDPNTLAMISNFKRNKEPNINGKWLELLNSFEYFRVLVAPDDPDKKAPLKTEAVEHYIGNKCLIDRLIEIDIPSHERSPYNLQPEIAKYLEYYYCAANEEPDEYARRKAELLNFYEANFANFEVHELE